jgi:hypothetical protein
MNGGDCIGSQTDPKAEEEDAPSGDPGADKRPARSDLRKRSFSLYGTTLALTN